ncbi:VC0807 family protein [Amycolatopsis sp. NPDC059021]|uniref:VC0807 family protein n=1 Tax=Amycolatopsis sp. NPDC059021 TaxID=3346704 RepID=UPI00366BFD44
MTNPVSNSRFLVLARDLVIPMAVFYVLRAFDVDALWALLLGGLPPALRVGWVALRERRIDPLGSFVLAMLVVNVAVSLISGDPRLLLIRNAWFGLLVGGWMLVSLAVGSRPFIYHAARTMVPGRTEPMERRWADDAAVRQLWRVATLWWGVGNLALGGVVVAMAYTLPVDSVPFLDALVTIAAIVGGLRLTRRQLASADLGLRQPVAA